MTNNVGVEVKYNTAKYVIAHANRLANQLTKFGDLNLNQIVVEFVQTKQNPVTEATLAELHQFLEGRVDLSNIVFSIIENSNTSLGR